LHLMESAVDPVTPSLNTRAFSRNVFPLGATAVWFIVSQKRPDDPCIFGRHCYARLCRPELLLFFCNPFAAGVIFLSGREYNRSRAVNQKRSQITIASLGDA